MRNLILILLTIILCSNECNKPYDAKVICASGQKECKVKMHNSLEFSVHWADVNVWKHRVEVAVRYRIINTSSIQADSINYTAFSLISASGIKLNQWHKGVGRDGTTSVNSGIHTLAPGGQIDSILIFYSPEKYSKDKGLDLLMRDQYSFIYSNGRTDTICKIEADDRRLK